MTIKRSPEKRAHKKTERVNRFFLNSGYIKKREKPNGMMTTAQNPPREKDRYRAFSVRCEKL
jgi:hypothetical protein